MSALLIVKERPNLMRASTRLLTVLMAACVLAVPLSHASAQGSKSTRRAKADKAQSKVDASQVKGDKDVPEVNLLDAVRKQLVSVQAEGRGDGRMTLTVTNHSRRQIRVILPPGLIAQGATASLAAWAAWVVAA
jgi:hypothetical protein